MSRYELFSDFCCCCLLFFFFVPLIGNLSALPSLNVWYPLALSIYSYYLGAKTFFKHHLSLWFLYLPTIDAYFGYDNGFSVPFSFWKAPYLGVLYLYSPFVIYFHHPPISLPKYIPLKYLHTLWNKKRKFSNRSRDFFKSNKILKSERQKMKETQVNRMKSGGASANKAKCVNDNFVFITFSIFTVF